MMATIKCDNGCVHAPESGKVSDKVEERALWTGKLDFLMSCIGFAVGLGNVWRFPYLCYKNGGGAFLVPYFICMVTGSIPVFFLEISLGQYMQQGGISVWNLCPIFKGIGIGTTVVCFLCNTYYIVVLAWALYYFCISFTSQLPWATCNNEWNSVRCFSPFNDTVNSSSTIASPAKPVDPVEEFWYYKVHDISGGVDEPGQIRWQLALCLLAVWIICYFCIFKGVKITGKVVYFTATFPYIVLTILLIRGVTLAGAGKGILYYLSPKWSKLREPQVWIDAGTQIFYSYGLALGAQTALGSYNPFHHNCYKDCIIIACVNSCTSLFAGFVVFSVLGFMSHEQGVPIDDVAESGPGLAFIAYPKAITQMPVAPFWSVLFFFMIMLVGLDSQFVGVEGFVTAVVDVFPKQLYRKNRREIFIAVVSLVSFILGLSMVTNGGLYVFYLWDYYAVSGMTMLWFCLFECIAIGWAYGASRFYSNIALMVGFTINPWLKICWVILTPAVTMAIFVFNIVRYKPLYLSNSIFYYEYPLWAQAIGWTMGLVSMVQIPIYICYKLAWTPKNKWRELITPAPIHAQLDSTTASTYVVSQANCNKCEAINLVES